MTKSTPYQPPYTLTPPIIHLVATIGEALGRLSAQTETSKALRLRRINRIRTIRGSLAIEGNTLSEEQITAILDGKRVLAPPREVQEARNAIAAYDRFEEWHPEREGELLEGELIGVRATGELIGVSELIGVRATHFTKLKILSNV